MATPVLQDIVEQIVFHLRHDKVSLSRLRLVSCDWDAPCRALLFYKIELKVLDPLDYTCMSSDSYLSSPSEDNNPLENATQDLLKRYNTLLTLIQAQPSLGNVPKELVLMRAHRLKPSIWSILEPVYGSILRHLKRVQRIHLNEVYFSHLSRTFFDALLEVCRQPTMTHYNVANCSADDGELLAEVLLASESLEHLKLLTVAPQNTYYPRLDASDGRTPCSSSALSRNRIRLKTLVLEITSIAVFSKYLGSASGIDLSGLKELKLHYIDTRISADVDFTSLVKVLQACASSLELLHISAPSGGCKTGQGELPVYLRTPRPRFIRLKTLRFSGVRFSREHQNNKINLITLCLSSIVQACELREIGIQTYIDSTKGDEVDWACWKPIDEILSDRTLFPFLKALTISLIVNDPRYANTLISLLKQQLPTMLDRGYLSVSIVS